MAQQQLHPGVFEHVAQAFAGIVRVQRHIGAAGLEHRQQGDKQLDATFQRHADAHLGADTTGDQLMGQTIGPGFQLGEAQALLAVYQSNGRWAQTRLLGDTLRQ